MTVALPQQAASVFERRRSTLAKRLAGRAALIFAGGDRARNYPANIYPYRADSHFLYLAGAGLPDAVLLVGDGPSELFMTPPDADDALWHGHTPAADDIATATGVSRVRPLSELAQAIEAAGGSERVGTLPSADPQTRYRQTQALGRTWPAERAPALDNLSAADLELADAMIEQRTIHDDAALEMIRGALEGTTAAHIAGMRATKPGLFERDVRAAMEHELAKRGMVTAYNSIVTVHGEVLHNTTYENPVTTGDLVLADLGGEHHGWASDVTRTWPASGEFSPTQRALYDIVLQSQLDAIAMVRPGVRYRDVHLRASLTLAQGLVDEGILAGDPESLVERGAHALLFPHGVGHLLGLDVHDMEDLGDRAGYAAGRTRSDQFGLGHLRLDRDLQPGMVVTIEPGLYMVPAILESERLAGPFVADGTLLRDGLAKFADVRGIRIEDDVLCTPTEPDVLSSAIPKEASAVEQIVRGGS